MKCNYRSVKIEKWYPGYSKYYGIVFKEKRVFIRVKESIRDIRISEGTVNYAGKEMHYNELPECLCVPNDELATNIYKLIGESIENNKENKSMYGVVLDEGLFHVDIDMVDGSYLKMSSKIGYSNMSKMDLLAGNVNESLMNLVNYIERIIYYCTNSNEAIIELDEIFEIGKCIDFGGLDGLDDELVSLLKNIK